MSLSTPRTPLQMQTAQCINPFTPREDETFHKVGDTLDVFAVLDRKPPSPLDKTKRLATIKTVTFASTMSPTSVLYGLNCSDLSESEKKRIWWHKKELNSIRQNARNLVKNIRDNSQENDVDYSYTCIMERVFKQRGNLSKEDELKLWLWVSKAHSRRGLERYIGQNGERCRMRRKTSIREVLECQKRLDGLKIDASVKSNMLAIVSKLHSGPEQMLAVAFGKADEAAAILQQLDP